MITQVTGVQFDLAEKNILAIYHMSSHRLVACGLIGIPGEANWPKSRRESNQGYNLLVCSKESELRGVITFWIAMLCANQETKQEDIDCVVGLTRGKAKILENTNFGTLVGTHLNVDLLGSTSLGWTSAGVGRRDEKTFSMLYGR